jgi:hypothetical protein
VCLAILVLVNCSYIWYICTDMLCCTCWMLAIIIGLETRLGSSLSLSYIPHICAGYNYLCFARPFSCLVIFCLIRFYRSHLSLLCMSWLLIREVIIYTPLSRAAGLCTEIIFSLLWQVPYGSLYDCNMTANGAGVNPDK